MSRDPIWDADPVSRRLPSSPPPTTTEAQQPCPVCKFHWNLIVMPGEAHNLNCPHATEAQVVDRDSGNEETDPSLSQIVIPEDSSLKAARGVCVHSMFKSDCMGCWQGHAARLESHISKLEASIALPIKERVEAIIEENVRQFYDFWKHHWLHVKDDPEQWIKNASHYLSWGINRALPMVGKPSTSGVLSNPELGMSVRSLPESSPAQAAAEALYRAGCGHVMEVDEIAEIISKHLNPSDPCGDTEAALTKLRDMECNHAISYDCYSKRYLIEVAWLGISETGKTIPEAMAKAREFKAGDPKPVVEA